jgi:AraC family transcriptional regulator
MLSIELRSGFHIATYPAGATFGPRRLRDYEFVWIMEGNAVYRHNDVVVETPQDAIVLCRPPATDAFRWDTLRRTRHAYFHFLLDGTLPEEWPASNEWPLVRPAQNHPSGDLLRAVFQHLVAWSESGDTAQMRFLALSLLAGYVTGQTHSGERTEASLPKPVADAMAFIARRLDEDPTVKLPLCEIASVACVTPEYLCRLFKTAIGRTPAETVRLARLDRALTLLARTNYSIGQIATLTGFESPFHFSRRFAEVYGRSPRALRRAIAEGTYTPMTRLLGTTNRDFS